MTPASEYRIFQFAALALVALALVLFAPGCISSQVGETVETVTAGADGYDRLIRATLDGTITPEQGKAVTPEDLAETPESVREFVDNLITAVYVTRKAWHTVRYMVGNGSDPKDLDLGRPPLEAVDSDTELLENE